MGSSMSWSTDSDVDGELDVKSTDSDVDGELDVIEGIEVDVSVVHDTPYQWDGGSLHQQV